jgi:anion exchange protein
MECILAGAISGILFALFAGQPLNILSATGPMLILENIISNLCKKFGLYFLEFRLWIGLWIAIFIFLMVMFNLSFMVKYITRFSEDCFAAFVSIMFIIDAIKSVIKIYIIFPPRLSGATNLTNNCTCVKQIYRNITTNLSDSQIKQSVVLTNIKTLKRCVKANGEWICEEIVKSYFPDIFKFSVLLFIVGFLIIICLKHFRHTSFLPSKIRQIFSDFSVLISILLISVINALAGIDTPKLTVPSKFSPTRSDRAWLIPFFGKNFWWTIFLAIPPAIIATLLVFMDQQITAVIVNRKEYKLKKGFGYHLDLLVVGVIIAICSILGLPWFVAATVLALTHVNALKEMSESCAPGERPKFLGVREQRMTGLLTSILIGLSVIFTEVLSYIPMSVLYAVFLNMGVSTLSDLDLVDRLLLVFMPSKHQPDYKYLRYVNMGRVHLFTFIQILSIGGMFLVKSIDIIAIAFPLLVLATCFIRKLLDYLFTQEELFWLDQLLPSAKKDNSRVTGSHGDLEDKSKVTHNTDELMELKPL